ncbi:MAG: hypothetical protein M1815_005473 [Lichina confinis]|nr:MAG: hypothetical protein M1815_005473 [Lichina confinis]
MLGGSAATAALSLAIVQAGKSHLAVHEALSGVFGSISLAAWIFLFVPQLLENYRRGNADGVSLWFIAIWFVGDVTNFFGAVGAGLVPTVVALAVYFCVADLILMLQCIFYNHINAKAESQPVAADDGSAEVDNVERPLLSRNASDSLYRADGRRRSSTAHPRRRSQSSVSARSALGSLSARKHGRIRAAVKHTASLLFVCVAGAVGWLLAWQAGAWAPTDQPSSDGSGVNISAGPQVLGYISAVSYLGARIPQIIKNYREQSCEGLSLLFFILSLFGNITYGASILLHSLDKDYLIVSLPWLLGSFGTMAEDIVIFVQFHIYSAKVDNSEAAVI